MSEYLPYGRFKWLKNINKIDIMSINDKSSIGCFLEKLTLNILMNYMNYIAITISSRKIGVSSDMLSKYCNKLLMNMK